MKLNKLGKWGLALVCLSLVAALLDVFTPILPFILPATDDYVRKTEFDSGNGSFGYTSLTVHYNPWWFIPLSLILISAIAGFICLFLAFRKKPSNPP